MAEPAYRPRFSYTDRLVLDLMAFEGACRVVDQLALPPDASFRIRYEARKRATHHSTRIEGNPLALESIAAAVAGSDRRGSAAEQEVRNYWRALEWLEEQVERSATIDEDFIRRLHRLIIVRGRGRRGERSAYRTGELAVRDTSTGQVDYAPPAPGDVPLLMGQLVAWRGSASAAQLPAPVRAGIMAHRFVSIHPFHDGNGRTTRALATAELWRSGYLMRGFLSVEEYYDADLPAYYAALQLGQPANYYDGRHECDLTPWLEFFVGILAAAAERVRQQAVEFCEPLRIHTAWEDLTRRQQQVLTRLVGQPLDSVGGLSFNPGHVAEWFGVTSRTAIDWLHQWADESFVIPASGSIRITSYRLRAEHESLVVRVRSAMGEGE